MFDNKKCTFKKRNGSVNDRIQFAQQVQNKLMAGTQYAAIIPSTAEVAGIIATVVTYQAECAAHNYVHKPQRDQGLVQLDNALSNQCKWINGMAQGNLDFLTDCGFALSKTPELRPEPTKAANVKIETLPNGQAFISCDHVDGAEWYQGKVLGPDSFKKWETGKYPKFKLSDLPMGVTLKVVMRAVNFRGEGAWSDSVNFVAPQNPESNEENNDADAA